MKLNELASTLADIIDHQVTDDPEVYLVVGGDGATHRDLLRWSKLRAAGA